MATQPLLLLKHRLGRAGLRQPLVHLRHRGVKPDDVFLASYPRSGSTWLRFQLFHALTGSRGEFGAVNQTLPDIGRHHGAPAVLAGAHRLIKTHELPRTVYRRAILLVRDPRDVALSEYSYLKMRGLYSAPLPDFLEEFGDQGSNSFGSWRNHTARWLDHMEATGGLIVRYEDLRSDPIPFLGRILDFLGEESVVPLSDVVEEASLKRMQDAERLAGSGEIKKGSGDPALRFIRKGQAGGWRTSDDAEVVATLDPVHEDLLRRLEYEGP